jgi:hypothetical protein
MLMDELKEIIKERNQVDNRVKPAAKKRNRESDNEGKEGNKVIRIDKQAGTEEGTQDRRHQYKIPLRKNRKRPVHLFEA